VTAPALQQLVESYCDLLWNLDPVAATAAGVTRYDGRLGRYADEDIQRYVAAFKSLGNSLEDCEVETLDDEVDRTALLGQIRTSIHQFEREQPHVRNPTFWASHVLEGLHLLLVTTSTPREARAAAAAGRVREIPAFLRAARETLRDCPTVFVVTASRVVAQGLSLVDEVEQTLAPEGDAEFPGHCRDARAALADFALGLDSDLEEDGNGSFAIGEEAFDFRLHLQHSLRATAPELWRFGMALVESTEAEIADVARRIDPDAPWPDVVSRLRAQHPDRDALVGAYRDQMERARRFVEERELVPMPAGPLEVVATPPFLRPLIPFAAYQPPGAFSDSRVGWFYVTPPDAAGVGAAQERLLRDHCTYELPGTALHEGYPGHHLQFLSAHAQPRLARKVLSSAVTVEGWALYCEEMMGEEGFYGSVEEHLFQKVALLWRACRVVLDVGLHTRGMPIEEAVAFLMDRVHFERAHAEAEVRRYCAEPVYQLCYAAGRRELLDLRNAYRAARGGDFTLRDFHNRVLQYGGLSVSLIRWGLGLDE
jgi:hypothetical protein